MLATTQMEATDARRAFPCWDEPDAKAVFGVTLVVPDDLLAISNAGEVGREPAGDGKVAVRFADTMPMSTYLVAFVVGPLAATDPVDVDGKPLRVVCPVGKEHLADFALEVGEFALRFFTDWFGIVYPGDKLDLVAIPDFAFGAMENLGCVTFRERYLLVDPATATQAELQAVVDVIAHEIAHMWFGDLVTMKWWNGIWLNEAFATFMEMTCTDAFRPEWQRWVDFGLSRSAAFDTDALGSTRPIEYPVISPADADGMFDVLTYEKGASVVRMLEQYLGAERFRAGIRALHGPPPVRQHRDVRPVGRARGRDAASRCGASPSRGSSRAGSPRSTVERADGDTLRFSQRRFGYGDDAGRRAPAGRSRWSSGTARGGAERRRPAVLGAARGQSADRRPGGRAAAVGQRQLRRPRLLPGALRRPTCSTRLLAGLGDAHAARALHAGRRRLGVGAGRRPTTAADFVGAGRAVRRRARPVGVGAHRRRARPVSTAWSTATPATPCTAGSRRWSARPAAELGADAAPGDDDRTRTLRGLLLQAAALLGDDGAARERAAELLDRFLAHPPSVDPSLASPALAVSATLGDVALHERLVDALPGGGQPAGPRSGCCSRWPASATPTALQRTLDLTLSGDVRTQDAPYLLGETLANRDNAADGVGVRGRRTGTRSTQRFPANSLSRLVGGIRSVRDRALADEITAFLADHPIPQGDMQVRQHIERMGVTVALAEREAARFAARSHDLTRTPRIRQLTDAIATERRCDGPPPLPGGRSYGRAACAVCRRQTTMSGDDGG